jgi:uncharacterized membrane protein YqjE
MMAARQTPSAPVPGVVDVRADDRSVGELMGDLARDLGQLVRQELELAKVEIKEELAKTGKAGGILGGTAVAAYMALVLLSFAAAYGLDAVMPTGFAFLIVGLVYAAVAAVLYGKGRQELRNVRPVPEQTVETLKEDVQWAKQQMT